MRAHAFHGNSMWQVDKLQSSEIFCQKKCATTLFDAKMYDDIYKNGAALCTQHTNTVSVRFTLSRRHTFVHLLTTVFVIDSGINGTPSKYVCFFSLFFFSLYFWVCFKHHHTMKSHARRNTFFSCIFCKFN